MSPYNPEESGRPVQDCLSWPPDVPPQYLDIWEHACLLYHNFEWEPAVQDFETLKPWTFCKHVRAILLLNIAIILCQIGDYIGAHTTLEQSAACWEAFPITIFLLGITKYELGLYDSAGSAFQDTASILHNANLNALDHKPAGLDFVLTAASLGDNDSSSRYAARLHSGDETHHHYPILHRLPAGSIFENPCAAPIQAACHIQCRSASTESQARSMSSEPLQNSEGTHDIDDSRVPEPPQQDLTEDSRGRPVVASAEREQIEDMNLTPAFETRRKLQLQSLRHRRHGGPVKQGVSQKADTVNDTNAPNNGSLRNRRGHAPHEEAKSRQRMIPRDARFEHHPLHEMASFLRHTGPEYLSEKSGSCMSRVRDPRARLEPRDALARPEDLSHLASFIRDTGPGRSSATIRRMASEPSSPWIPNSAHVVEKTSHQQFTYRLPRQRLNQDCPTTPIFRSSSIYFRPIDSYDPVSFTPMDKILGVKNKTNENPSRADANDRPPTGINKIAAAVLRLGSSTSVSGNLSRGMSNPNREQPTNEESQDLLEVHEGNGRTSKQSRWLSRKPRR